MREWPSGKVLVTVSKFNVYFPHLTGCFHLQTYAVFSMTSVNVHNAPLTQLYGFCKHGKVTFAVKACPVIDPVMHQRPQLDGFM